MEPEIWTIGKQSVAASASATSPLIKPGADAHRHTPGCLVTHPAAAALVARLRLRHSARARAVAGQSISKSRLNLSNARDGHRWVLAVIAFLEDGWPADEIADRARCQSELREEPDGGAGRDHVGEVLLGVGGDQYHW
jgi:hypothetical protein